MALEELQVRLGPRFINAGVAEQNMVSVAAGMARQDLEVWVYSIAPFCYARPFEQVRNDIAFHNLPVKLVGNGGGYAYGVMGPTHHAIEDYGVLLTLPNFRVFIPVFDEDLNVVVDRVGGCSSPCYLRLGRGEAPNSYQPPPYAPWRQLTQGGGPVVIAVGPLAGTYVQLFQEYPSDRRPNLWAVAELPLKLNPMPESLRNQLFFSGDLHVAEEHVARGSFGAELALHLLTEGFSPLRFSHHCAQAHHFQRYGSQSYLRECSALDPAAINKLLQQNERAR